MLHDATFWAFAALCCFLALTIYLGVPGKIVGAIDAHGKQIADDLDEARRLRDEAQALMAEYKAKAQAAEQDAANIIARAKEDAERMKLEAEKSLADMVARRTKAAEDKIARAEAGALAEVKATAAEVAISAAEKVLAQRVGSGLGADLVAKSIAEIKANLN